MDERYNDLDFVYKYIGLWSYGYLNNLGLSESLYRTIFSLVVEQIPNSNQKIKILDIGCGIGRTSFDMAKFYSESIVDSIDQSALMIEYAKKLNSKIFSHEKFSIPRCGFKGIKFPSYNFTNINFYNTSLEDFAVNYQYDIILNINFLDRCENIDYSINKICNLLKCRGYVIGCTPLNFRNNNWKYITNVENLRKEFLKRNLNIIIDFDNLIYREVLDIRGAFEEYRVYCFVFQKN